MVIPFSQLGKVQLMDTSFDKIEVEVDKRGQKYEKATTFINNRIHKEVFYR